MDSEFFNLLDSFLASQKILDSFLASQNRHFFLCACEKDVLRVTPKKIIQEDEPKAHSPPSYAAIGTIHVDVHILKPYYTKTQVNPRLSAHWSRRKSITTNRPLKFEQTNAWIKNLGFPRVWVYWGFIICRSIWTMSIVKTEVKSEL